MGVGVNSSSIGPGAVLPEQIRTYIKTRLSKVE